MSGNSGDAVVGCMPFAPFGWITGATPAVPDFYWNVVSQEQRWKFLCCNLKALVEYANQLGVQINASAEDIDKLQEDFEALKDGKFWDFYEQQIQAWVAQNMPSIIKSAISTVYFGLTDDGYFCAYMPESWSEITFDTGAVYGRSDYGRLILKMQTDSPSSIDNTYSYSLSQPTSLSELIADLEVNAKRTDSVFDTVYTNLDQTVSRDGDNA